MKKLLFITFSLFSFTFSYSQCVPDSTYADSTFGVWPTPQTNFPSGDIGVYYDEVVYFKVPRDAGNVDSSFAGQLIDSIILSSVTNLPPGLTYQCDIPSCTWNYDSVGCASITGTPTTNGSYQISLDATVWTEIFLTPFPVPYSFNGYSINIGPTSDNTLGSSFSNLILENPVPNPSNNSTNISYRSINSWLTNYHQKVNYRKQLEYLWNQNKGYPTKKHKNAISKFGITKYHRKSFKLT